MKQENRKTHHPNGPLNRRKPENRWTRILRDADRDQYETVRRWLKLAGDCIRGDRTEEEQPDLNLQKVKRAA